MAGVFGNMVKGFRRGFSGDPTGEIESQNNLRQATIDANKKQNELSQIKAEIDMAGGAEMLMKTPEGSQWLYQKISQVKSDPGLLQAIQSLNPQNMNKIKANEISSVLGALGGEQPDEQPQDIQPMEGTPQVQPGTPSAPQDVQSLPMSTPPASAGTFGSPQLLSQGQVEPQRDGLYPGPITEQFPEGIRFPKDIRDQGGTLVTRPGTVLPADARQNGTQATVGTQWNARGSGVQPAGTKYVDYGPAGQPGGIIGNFAKSGQAGGITSTGDPDVDAFIKTREGQAMVDQAYPTGRNAEEQSMQRGREKLGSMLSQQTGNGAFGAVPTGAPQPQSVQPVQQGQAKQAQPKGKTNQQKMRLKKASVGKDGISYELSPPDVDQVYDQKVNMTYGIDRQTGNVLYEWPGELKNLSTQSNTINTNIDMGVSKTTASQIEQSQRDLLNSRDALKNSMDKYDNSFSTFYGQAGAKGVAMSEKIGLDKVVEKFGGDTTKAKQYLADFTAWDSSVRQQFNEYRKYITGAAAGMPEIDYLTKATVSEKDSPTQIRSKTKELLEMGQRVMNRNKIFMTMGLKTPEDVSGIPSDALPKDYDLTDEQAKQIYDKYSNSMQEKVSKLDPESKIQYEQILNSGDKAKIKAANDRILNMK